MIHFILEESELCSSEHVVNIQEKHSLSMPKRWVYFPIYYVCVQKRPGRPAENQATTGLPAGLSESSSSITAQIKFHFLKEASIDLSFHRNF